MNHSFDIDYAKKFGVNAAVILHNIVFWIWQNKANDRNCHDGKFWTYNSIAAMSTLFPYMTPKQIRTALEILKINNIITTGNYSENKGDRSLWYALVDEDHHLTCMANGLPSRARPSARRGKSSINNTDSKPDDVGASATKTFEERKNEFRESIRPHVPDFSVQMLKEFVEYWTEPNKTKTKMRFEMEKTWEIKRRLTRWKQIDELKNKKQVGAQNQIPISRQEGTNNQHILDELDARRITKP